MTHLKLKPLSKQTSLIDTMQNSGQPANPNRRDGLYDTNSRLSDAASRTGLCSNPALPAGKTPVLTATIAVAGGVALAAWLGSKVTSSPALNAS